MPFRQGLKQQRGIGPAGETIFYRADTYRVLGTLKQRRERLKMKLEGTGKDPLGRYPKGLIFDLEDNDQVMIDDFVDKGWAKVLAPEDHPGRTVTQIAAAVVRGDALTDPAEAKIAAEIGDRAHAIVHLDDPDATNEDYEDEAAKNREQGEYAGQIATDSLGGIPGKEKRGGSKTAEAPKAETKAEEKQPAAAAAK